MDLSNDKCLTCIPSSVFTLSTNLKGNICKPVTDTVDTGCAGLCSVGTASYVAAVVSPATVE